MPKPAIECHLSQAQLACRADDQLPKGVIGRISGIALVYGVVDDHGTRFVPGCLDRTRREKLAAGKMQLFVAEDQKEHQYGTRTHVGTVRGLEDVGDSVVMSADLHDTEPAANLKRYVEAVIVTNGFTGISIGFRPRATRAGTDENGDPILEFTEIEIPEITITTMPAVPGAQVLAVRNEPDSEDTEQDTETDTPRLIVLRSLLQTVPKDVVQREIAAHDATSTPDADGASEHSSEERAASGDDELSDKPATYEDRLMAVRHVHGTRKL